MDRIHVLVGLIVCFVAVSAIAYTDYPRGGDEPPLDELERLGLDVWRRHNCQACHQVHGFGGFHGPDLTNRVTADTADGEIVQTIALGKGRMPAFELEDDEYEALVAWLRWLNDFGRAQPPPLAARNPIFGRDHFDELLSEWTRRRDEALPADVEAGLELWNRWTCGTCHLPFAAGAHREPDLTAAALDRSVEALAILDTGSGRMPATPMDDAEKRAMSAFLEYLAAHRAELVELDLELIDHEPFELGSVPWFEYE